MKPLVLLLFIIHISVAVTRVWKNQTALPIVLWHGLGDTCCIPVNTGLLRLFLHSYIPGVYTVSINIGANSKESLENSYLLNPNQQVEHACKVLRKDKHLVKGFNMMGLAQGSLFLRAVIQRCGHKLPPIKNYISLGGPQQGVNNLSRCIAVSHQTCRSIKELLAFAAYHSATQRALVPATYWHDPLREDEYKNKSIFLADINNENGINETYRTNLKKLEHFVMVKFDNDSVIQPRESAWFGFFVPGQWKEVQTLQQSRIYLEDRLGLQEMDRAGKLVFLTHPKEHLQLEKSWFIQHIIMKYLLDNDHKANLTSSNDQSTLN